MRSNIKSYSVYLGKYVNPIYTSILILMFFVMNQFFFSYLSEIKIISTITSLILPAVIDIIFILIFFKAVLMLGLRFPRINGHGLGYENL